MIRAWNAAALCAALLLVACNGATGRDEARAPTAPEVPTEPPAPGPQTLSVIATGMGEVASTPVGISCGTDCSEAYAHNTAVTLTATPLSGWRFGGWSGACTNATGDCLVTMDRAQTVAALFTEIPRHSLNVASDAARGRITSMPMGIDCGTDCSETYAEGASVQLTAAANGGFRFAGWSGACTGLEQPCRVVMNAAATVGALFEAIPTYPLSVNRSGAGRITSMPAAIDCPSTCTANLAENSTITLTAVPDGGFDFAGWSGACTNTSGTCEVSMDRARTVGALFTAIPRFQLSVAGVNGGTVTSTPTGISCGSDCAKEFLRGSTVALNAVAAVGFRFDSFGGACSGSTCNVTMDADKTVTALFIPQERLSLSQFGSGTPGRSFTLTPASACRTLTANASYDCDRNASVTITAAAPPTGVYFAGWYEAPECGHEGLDGGTTAAQPYRRSCTVTMAAARSLGAAFASTPTAPANAEADAAACDLTVPQYCFFPFPNNHFTRAKGMTDPSSFTGLMVNLQTQGRFPTTASNGMAPSGTFEPTEWNRNDGFSLNPKLVTFVNAGTGTTVRGMDEDDLDATRVPHLVDLSRSLDADSPVLLLNATPKVDAAGNPCTTGAACVANPDYLKRVLVWAEPEMPKRELRDSDGNGRIDTHVIRDAERSLTIRVGTNLNYRQRYIVALRYMKRSGGTYIEAEPNFRLFRDNQAIAATAPTLAARRAKLEDIFTVLKAAGVERWQLAQAWDFTVISQENLHERMLHMRDTAFTSLGGNGVPCYTVEAFPNPSDAGAPAPGAVSPPYVASTCTPGTQPMAVPGNTGIVNESGGDIFRTISGTIAVPCFMGSNCAIGSTLNYLPATAVGQDPVYGDNKPDQPPGSIFKANWQCRIPRAASGANPSRISLYGHGLLGGLGEVRSGHVASMANRHNITFCAMNWTGFATEDAPTAAQVGADISAFSTFIDRQMQGHLAWLTFQELIVRGGGLMEHPAFRTTSGCPDAAASCPLYRTDFNTDGSGGMFYDGNSQGGIMGGALVALSKRVTRGVLGVPGMNYSILLRRSSDFQIQEGEEPGVGATGINFVLQNNFPNDFDQAFIYSLSTMIWERSENAGFATHFSKKPLPNTPPHEVLLQVGYGDHQVSIWTNDIIARAAGIPVIANTVDYSARYAATDPLSGGKYGMPKPFFGIEPIPSYPYVGSALSFWESGLSVVDNPPLYNAPPRTKEDPHEHPRRSQRAQLMKSLFLRSDREGSAVFDTCEPGLASNGNDGGPCFATDRN